MSLCLFFRLVVPLPKARVFSLFMNKVISKPLNLRANIIGRVVLAFSKVIKFSTAIKSFVNSISNICNNTIIKNSLN